jgi:hypothetical protein
VVGRGCDGMDQFLQGGIYPCGTPADLISVMQEAPFDMLGALRYQLVFSGSDSSKESGGFLQRVTMVWVCSLHLFSYFGWLSRKKKS